MGLETKGKFYRFHLTINRIKNGLILFSIRNLLMRIGINIMPYFWVREGLYPIDEPKIGVDKNDCEIKYFDFTDLEEIKKTRTIFGNDFSGNLKNGQKCLGLKHNGKIAAFMFIQFDDLVFGERIFHLKSNEAYLLNMFTYNDFRGKNLAPYLRYRSYKLLKNDGVDKIYSISSYFNKSARRFKEKLKAQNLQLHLCIILFKKYSWKFIIKEYTPLAPVYDGCRTS